MSNCHGTCGVNNRNSILSRSILLFLDVTTCVFLHRIGLNIADKPKYIFLLLLLSLLPSFKLSLFLMFHTNLHNNNTTSILRFLRCGVRLDSCLSSHHRRRCGIFATWIWEAQTTSWTRSLVQALARVAVSPTSARGSEKASDGRGVRMVCGITYLCAGCCGQYLGVLAVVFGGVGEV